MRKKSKHHNKKNRGYVSNKKSSVEFISTAQAINKLVFTNLHDVIKGKCFKIYETKKNRYGTIR